MDQEPITKPACPTRVGRPRRGTEQARADSLISAATRVFLRDGYGGSSIEKVATEAGVSTRTIYERHRNKAELFGAVVSRLVDQDICMALAPEELARFDPRQALTSIGQAITRRAVTPEARALFRIVITESQRFPELAAKMRGNTKQRVDDAVAHYLRDQVQRGRLDIADPERAAVVFLHMVCAEVNDCLLFGRADDMTNLGSIEHLQQVVDIFLNGTLSRGASRVAAKQPMAGGSPCSSPGSSAALSGVSLASAAPSSASLSGSDLLKR